MNRNSSTQRQRIATRTTWTLPCTATEDTLYSRRQTYLLHVVVRSEAAGRSRLGGAPVQLPRLRRRASPPHAQHVVDSDTQCLPPSSYVLRSTFPLCDFCRGASRSSSWLAGHCHSRYNHRPPASCGRSIEFYRLAGFRQTANRVPTNG